MKREEAGLCGDLLLPPPSPPAHQVPCLFPALYPKDTHHYGANHRAFDHPPQNCVVIHIPAAAKQTEGKKGDYPWGSGPLQDNASGSVGATSSPELRRAGWKGSSRAACTGSPHRQPSPDSNALVLPSAPRQGRSWSPRLCSSFRLGALGDATSPLTLSL